jgi:hypothetical protein
MATYNPLSWQNENALSGYPFKQELELSNFIVDANFIQFDNFIPILNKVFIDTDKIELTLTFDCGVVSGVSFHQEKYAEGDAYRLVRIYQPSNNRYLGMLTFGEGLQTIWEQYKGQTFVYNTPFVTETVRSIPSKDAVYLFDSSYGDIHISRTAQDRTIFYNASEELNSITFNAVGGHTVEDVIDAGAVQGLKQINLVKPLHNNINLASNDVIKINPVNASSLQISLVAGNKSTAFAIPTLIA